MLSKRCDQPLRGCSAKLNPLKLGHGVNVVAPLPVPFGDEAQRRKDAAGAELRFHCARVQHFFNQFCPLGVVENGNEMAARNQSGKPINIVITERRKTSFGEVERGGRACFSVGRMAVRYFQNCVSE